MAQAATVLRIRPVFLQAIEDGHVEALPGLPYAIGFVRTYADHLGLDGAELVRRFKSEAAGLERKTSLSFPSPAPEGRVPGTAALLISLIAATVVFGGWYFYQSGAERFVLRVPEVPERLAAPPPAVVADTPADAQPGASAAAAPSSPVPASQVPPAPTSVPTPPGQTAAVAPALPPAGRPSTPLGSDGALPPPPGDPTRRLATVAPPPPA
ncbi:MAG: helix-turn-helix domain-containing protein, partial [Alphaproteobacteria bacterium]|nr:helix-turn-helix domain-containing protein [Alphaproteobacteria bacterium]